MSTSAFNKALHSTYCILVTYVIGVTLTALLAPAFQASVSFGAVPILSFALALFGLPVIAPLASVGGLVISVTSSWNRTPWGRLLVLALVLGLCGSVLFQYLRPFEFYHEVDGSRPGWEPIRIASSVTTLALSSSLLTIMASALLFRHVLK